MNGTNTSRRPKLAKVLRGMAVRDTVIVSNADHSSNSIRATISRMKRIEGLEFAASTKNGETLIWRIA